jgi:hypothetical protein
MNWPERRRALLERLTEIQLALRPPRVNELSIDDRRKTRRRLDRILREYAENLPFLPISRCPICEQEFALAMDAVALDGPWWWHACYVPFPPPRACQHYQVFLGALDLHGRAPAEATLYGAMPGPGAPFVIERLLAMDGVRAVVSRVTMDTGDDGYPIVYFAEQAIPQGKLHQEWRKQFWVLRDAEGKALAEDHSKDPWDFELGPWLESGKLLWIEPGDEKLALRTGVPSPYLGLPGVREEQIISGSGVTLRLPPDGSPHGLFTPA